MMLQVNEYELTQLTWLPGCRNRHCRFVTSRTDFLKSHIQDSNVMQDVRCAWLLGFARLLGVAWCRNSMDFLRLPRDIALSSKLTLKVKIRCLNAIALQDVAISCNYQLSSNWLLPCKHHILVKITQNHCIACFCHSRVIALESK